MAEKTEKPTHKKLDDARKKGQIAMSRDLAKLLTLSALGETAFATEPMWRQSVQAMMVMGTERIGQPFMPALIEISGAIVTLLLIVVVACFVIGVVVGVLGHWGQFGILISAEVLKPNFDKLNPVNGFKQLFSKKKLVELLLSTMKAALIAWIAYILIRDSLPDVVQLAGGTPADIHKGFIDLLQSIFRTILGVCFVIAVVDFASQKYFHEKDLMMDMEEIKREYKESEGDPMVKGQRRALAQELAMSGPVAATQNANAVVVNPTHFAVAMLYDGDTAPVPVVLAKGKDEVAQAMIERARELGIPVIRHVWLARNLYATGREDKPVPKATYQAVALVYAVVAELMEMGEPGRSVELESLGEPPEGHPSRKTDQP